MTPSQWIHLLQIWLGVGASIAVYLGDPTVAGILGLVIAGLGATGVYLGGASSSSPAGPVPSPNPPAAPGAGPETSTSSLQDPRE
jgi:hypothetical protein